MRWMWIAECIFRMMRRFSHSIHRYLCVRCRWRKTKQTEVHATHRKVYYVFKPKIHWIKCRLLYPRESLNRGNNNALAECWWMRCIFYWIESNVSIHEFSINCCNLIKSNAISSAFIMQQNNWIWNVSGSILCSVYRLSHQIVAHRHPNGA